MIALNDVYAPQAARVDGLLSRPLWREIRTYQLHLGAERVALLGDEHNRLMAVIANRLSPAMEKFLDKMNFNEPGERCEQLELMLGVGYVVASRFGVVALLWLNPHPLEKLRLELKNLLLEGAA